LFASTLFNCVGVVHAVEFFMKSFPKYWLTLVIAAACHSVIADGLNDVNEVDEVIVTASPLDKTAEAVNRPVNLLSGDNLKNAAAATLGETLKDQLGVSTSSFGPGVGLPIIRGQSDNRVKVMQDSVGSMDASAASPDHAVAIEPLLASKIEVLRGPAALRYGSGAIGGVVNVLDNRIPSELPDDIDGGVELRHASVNKESAGVANLNFAAGNFAFHLDGIKRDSDDLKIPGYADDQAATTKDHIANTDANAKSGTFGASYIGASGFIGASVNKLDNNYGVPPEGEELVRIDLHQTRTDVKAELNNPFAGFEKISARLGHNDYKHTELENGAEGTVFTNDAYEGRAEIIHKPLDIFGIDWAGALGLQLAQSTFAAVGEEAFIPEADISSSGFFILEETKLGAWVYELGARMDTQKITPTLERNSVSHKSNNVSGTVTWHFTDSQQLNVGLAQSQRAPSIEELFANGPHPATGSYLTGDETLSKETSQNIELGYHWHNGDVKFSANIFYNQIQNFIYTLNLNEIIDDLNRYQYAQADAKFRGLEIEAKIPVANGLNLRLFGDSVRATLDDGEDLPRITPPRIGSSLDYDVNAWSAGVSATHTTKQDHAGANETETDGYNRIDARISYLIKNSTGDYTIFLKATNLANAEIRNASSYLRDIAPEAGRGVQLGARYSF
jgi:iron complex outermembrane recepter protein